MCSACGIWQLNNEGTEYEKRGFKIQKKFTAHALYDNKKVNTVHPPLCGTLLATYNCKYVYMCKEFQFLVL